MPSAIEPTTVASGQPVIGNRGYNIGHQKVGLEVEFATRSLRGWTEITINPTDSGLRQIRLNARQCKITRCTINKKHLSQYKYQDPYQDWILHGSATIHQHSMLRQKLARLLQDPPVPELVIMIPSKIKIETVDSVNIAAQHVLSGINSERGTPDVLGTINGIQSPAPTAKPENMYTPYVPLVIRIEYVVEHIRDGFSFVGCDTGDGRYPHAYTTNTPYPGASCCIFPTLDGIHEQWTWDIEVVVPKTIKDIYRTSLQADGIAKDTDNLDDLSDAEMAEDSDLEFTVVCTADFVDEETHPTEPWKKVFKFSQPQSVAPQHISIAIGPFEAANLSEFRDVENEATMGTMSVEVVGYALPGREADLRNTCMFLPKAIDYIVKEFGQYPFSEFKLCFVDDLATDTVEAASLVLCSNRLLFPDTVIDPIWSVTRTLAYALSAQWAGVQVVAKEWSDLWVVVGMACWMTNCFLKTLMGNNEYRFRLKKDAERVCELDIGRPSLYAQGFDVPIEPEALGFMKLKSSLVLTILEKRLWKLSSSMVLHRVVRKIFLSAVAGELKNGLIGTSHFIRLCEKNSHNKLEPFFAQWVKGSGYPRFEISQRFNKKRMIVEMGIRQTQALETPRRQVTPDGFLSDARDRNRGIVLGLTQAVFTGPMTIRIHEADGTPYEHVVDLKEGYTKLDIPYNTKYKRLKRTRRQKERAAVGTGVDVNTDSQNDDVLLYCLGDVLQGDDDMEDWRLVDWSKEDEDRMSQESFEWIRMDADFEWICTLNIGQPDYMFLSQLQQDRDVIAQYDSIKHFAKIRESSLVSTILIRTLMDRRYFFGIRVEAAKALARCATADLDWVGQFHLLKAFHEFFCFPGSSIPRGNDFSDFTAYYVQKAIPEALSNIRNENDECPFTVQKWLLDLLRYNDNTNNSFDDVHYVATLMRAVANTLTASEAHIQFHMNFEFDQDNDSGKFHETVLAEVERFRKMDQFHQSYRNIISVTALEIEKNFALAGVKAPDYRLFLSYAREGTLDTLRIKAFDCLLDLGAIHIPALEEYILDIMAHDTSPYIRRNVQTAFGRGLGMIALGDGKRATERLGNDLETMIIDKEDENTRQIQLARANIDGAMLFLKDEVTGDHLMKNALWQAVLSQDIGLIEIRYLLDICRILFESKESIVVKLKLPKYYTCQHLGKGLMRFSQCYRQFLFTAEKATGSILPLAQKLIPPSGPKLKLNLKPSSKANGFTTHAKKAKEQRSFVQRQSSTTFDYDPRFCPIVPTMPVQNLAVPPSGLQKTRKIVLKVKSHKLPAFSQQLNNAPK